MKLLKRILFAVPVLFFYGCATTVTEKELPPVNEELHIVELKKSTAETDTRLDELNNKFLLLHEKVTANSEKLEELKTRVTTVVPPQDLRVIKLTDQGTAEEEPAAKEPAPDPEALYTRGQDLFLAGKHKRAIEVFSGLAEKFPGHSLADNALYWTGESYYSLRDFERALVKFKEVVDRYPSENKAPAAMLKLGYSHMELDRIEKGAGVLKRLLSEYPESEAADKARKKLKEIPN